MQMPHPPTSVALARYESAWKRNLLGLTSPVFTAYITMAAVLLTPSLDMMFFRWVVMVWVLRKSLSATWVLVNPSAIARALRSHAR